MLRLIQTKVNDQQILEWLRITINSSAILQFLVNDSLDYFQIKQGKFKLKESAFTVKELVEEAFELVDIQMKHKGLRKEIQIEDTVTGLEY